MTAKIRKTVRVIIRCKQCKHKFEHFTRRGGNKKEYCEHCSRKRTNKARGGVIKKVWREMPKCPLMTAHDLNCIEGCGNVTCPNWKESSDGARVQV